MQEDNALDALRLNIKRDKVTLLFAAKDKRYNNALALQEYLREDSSKAKSSG
jgi:uncharacterized protein YeaO (DUF488 family)